MKIISVNFIPFIFLIKFYCKIDCLKKFGMFQSFEQFYNIDFSLPGIIITASEFTCLSFSGKWEKRK